MTPKRSAQITLPMIRKHFALKPLTVGVVGVLLAACSDNRQEATVYTNEQDCKDANPEQAQTCVTAYKQALAEAERTAPKYNSQGDCESEFGPNQCRYVERNSSSFFIPFMTGYMISNLLSPNRYQYQPLFTSYSPYSSYRHRWVGADGYDYGDIRKRNYKVKPDAFKPKPTVSKTIKRGGFGSSVRAKSSWGSKSSGSKGGWGG
ncbi:DUF1190 family protein [Aliiglaciecola sp. LCG003]|uniref:DUF1190 family protein n=1 Tax=Aliiglaciecola sp. LCG003 TaxID=3053655 RepID=UPI0025733202|nr:DUF1190 family protein [Aliiglaciecola sp. LCG003]WJG08443.1 DUF1190 family protein [Aliiglaciecola sp. LCG003]